MSKERRRPEPVLVFLDGIEVNLVHGRGTHNYVADKPDVPNALATGTTIEEAHRRANLTIGAALIRKP